MAGNLHGVALVVDSIDVGSRVEAVRARQVVGVIEYAAPFGEVTVGTVGTVGEEDVMRPERGQSPGGVSHGYLMWNSGIRAGHV